MIAAVTTAAVSNARHAWSEPAAGPGDNPVSRP
jgi:hypothetical protein